MTSLLRRYFGMPEETAEPDQAASEIPVMQAVKETAVLLPETDYTEETNRLNSEFARLGSRKHSLWKSEGHAIGQIDRRMNEITARLTEIRELRPLAGLSSISWEVLTWRHSKTNMGVPVPKLALIDPQKSSKMTITGDYEVWGMSRKPHSRGGKGWVIDGCPRKFHGRVETLYGDVGKIIGERSGSKNITLSFTFTGVIPAKAKQIIQMEKERFSLDGSIGLLIDAPFDSWTLEKTEPLLVDPLIVGVKAGKMWLLGQFDPTPIETYIASEFTS